jgi:hypothetical protein
VPLTGDATAVIRQSPPLSAEFLRWYDSWMWAGQQCGARIFSGKLKP